MIIKVTYGKGNAKTKLAAFDNALYNAGIADYNLITLSSIIPPDSKVIVEKLCKNNKDIGSKLYVVLTKCIEVSLNKVACTGLGWVTREDGSGIFVEEFGSNEAEVKKIIKNSLESVIKYREGNYSPINYKIESIKCVGKPVCAIVAAVYKSEKW